MREPVMAPANDWRVFGSMNDFARIMWGHIENEPSLLEVALKPAESPSGPLGMNNPREAPLAPLTFGAFDIIKSMAKETKDASRACRPFDATRTGFVMAEGGGSLIMESLEHARARGAHIYAEVLGYTLNNDAYHMTSSLPEGESALEAMRFALDEAKLRPDQIDYINAHASSTPMNDGTEARVTTKFFGKKTPAISGTKPYYGHALGASGAIEAAICCLAIEHSHIPPTLNCHEPCDEITPGFDLVRLKGRSQPLKYVLSNSFGFGGINASLVFGKVE